MLAGFGLAMKRLFPSIVIAFAEILPADLLQNRVRKIVVVWLKQLQDLNQLWSGVANKDRSVFRT